MANSIFFDHINQILALFYPRFCLLCRSKLNKDNGPCLCSNCRQSIKVIKKPFCLKCGEYLEVISKVRKNGCSKCYRKNFFFDQVLSACRYKGPVKQGIHFFKYKRKTQFSDIFSKVLLDFLLDNFSTDCFDIITAVPLHKNKLKKRGYNQSRLVAETISDRLNIEKDFDCLIRKKNTSPQAKLSAKSRHENIKNAFYCRNNNSFKNKNILIIDDILTTGSTLNECSKALKQAGAKSVTCLTIAR